MNIFNSSDSNSITKSAFVSTNSISQGEQVGILWNELFNKYKIKIFFAHRTFKWGNESRNNAAVHVVIIGFSNIESPEKSLFEYDTLKSEGYEIKKIKNINPYLVEGNDTFLLKRRTPMMKSPIMNYGSMPNDGGYLLMNNEQKDKLLKSSPQASKFIKKFVMGEELINNISKWCLWLEEASPHEIKEMPEVVDRIENVKKVRINSNRQATKELANFPTRFGEVRQPKNKYIAIPVNTG